MDGTTTVWNRSRYILIIVLTHEKISIAINVLPLDARRFANLSLTYNIGIQRIFYVWLVSELS